MFSEFIRTFKSGRLNEALTREMKKATNAVQEFQKPATLKIEVKISPKDGITFITCKHDLKEPKQDSVSQFMYPTPEGNLLANDPRQDEMKFNKNAKVIEGESTEIKVAG